MLLVTPVDSRRVLVLGAAGLVPAALVTLLFVHQPSIGDRRLYPMLRGSVTVVGLGLALAALITWATASGRLSRSSLSGLAWAGVTTILCIGPFLESNPRPRLYALDLDTGELVETSSQPDTGQATAGGRVCPRLRGHRDDNRRRRASTWVRLGLEGKGWSMPLSRGTGARRRPSGGQPLRLRGHARRDRSQRAGASSRSTLRAATSCGRERFRRRSR